MRDEDILSKPARILTQEERESFFKDGYVVKKKIISDDWLGKLNEALAKLIEKSKSLTKSDGTFVLEDGHTSDNPRLRRIAFMDEMDPIFHEFQRDSNLPDMAADILGPDVRFRENMINIKWSGGGQEVKWHQDFPFYPLTNRAVGQFLICLDDVGPEQGPLQVVPGSHRGPIYDHYDSNNNWLGFIEDEKLKEAKLDTAVDLIGPAGTVSVHHCCALHASRPNLSTKGRPVLIITYAACDAYPYTAVTYPTKNYGEVVRGKDNRFCHHEEMDIRLPPDWSGGYTSIFEHQEEK
tara:strand:- start:273 stop:1154 length:882 start_codon:yes stop_codon:yes gene_type:complete